VCKSDWVVTTEQRGRGSVYQEVHDQQGRTQTPAVMLLVVSHSDQIVVEGQRLGWGRRAALSMNSGLRAGGTGLEPATCGCGDSIRRVGWCRQMPLCQTLAVVWCRWMSPGVAGNWGRYWGVTGSSPTFTGVGVNIGIKQE